MNGLSPRPAQRGLAFGSALLMMCSCALAQGASPQMDSPNLRPVERACAETMGLQAGSKEFEACADSLRRTSRMVDGQKALQQKRMSCAGRGLNDGTPGFAACVLDAPATSRWTEADGMQEARACGELGLAPGDAGFSGCVEHLASAVNFQRYPLGFGE